MKRSLIDSFNYAVSGIIQSIKTEKNMLIHYIIAIGVLGLSLFFDFSRLEFLILLFAIALVLTLEMINTAIEKTIDMITKDYHPLARIVKDIAAGAVLIAAVNALIVGYLLFFDRLSAFSEIIFMKIRRSPIHLTFISLLLVILFTIGLKAKYYRGRGTHFQGGTVSGHSAIAFCIATIISFLVENILVVTLAYGLAFLVGESRVEGKIHTAIEVTLGAVLGILVAILAFQIIN
ncbi:MAG: phosphatase PAP2 family protein [Tissierellia bacterium]|nr:phosphatase PAP2 family protein [Tissierellia bacterium]